MESVTTVERLRQALESEEASAELTAMPPETYVGLSKYAQKLRAMTAGSGDDASARLARKQLWLIEVMTRRLLRLRLAKAEKAEQAGHESEPGPSRSGLLPEEQHINGMRGQIAKKEARFVKAVVDGQPSFFTLVQRSETERMTTVRVLKRVGEMMGTDLKRYGPFEVHDVARLPAGNAQAMVSNKQAEAVSSDEF
jgi:DNA replication initiation complex subunit (GINS family)